MARQRNPSGIPSSRIIPPVYGSQEPDIYARVGNHRAGLLSVRRTLAIIAALVATLAVGVAVFGSTASASGIAWLMLAPLLVILAVLQLAVIGSGTADSDTGQR
jgi:hypothetical protein